MAVDSHMEISAVTCSSSTRALSEDLGRDTQVGSGRAGSWLRGAKSGPATGLQPHGLGFLILRGYIFIDFGDKGREKEGEAKRGGEGRK